MISFEYPYLLFLLFIPILLLLHYIYIELNKRRAHLRVSIIKPWIKGQSSTLKYLRHLPFVFRFIALLCIIIAIARPRSSAEISKVDAEGIDIGLVMDISPSMLARDFEPDRISAAKDIAIEFISQRASDRICIVVFSGESYTQCPLTTDRASLINLMKDVNIQEDVLEDGTAIGSGLATAVNRLKDSEAKSKVLILLTDGINNCGEIDPMMAAELAKSYKIKVYTIGVGTNGVAPTPVVTPWGTSIQNVKSEIDEDLLIRIASETGGKYFRATDNTKLAEIYNEINQLEKVKTTVESYPLYKELFTYFAIVSLICFILEFILQYIIFRKLP